MVGCRRWRTVLRVFVRCMKFCRDKVNFPLLARGEHSAAEFVRVVLPRSGFVVCYALVGVYRYFANRLFAFGTIAFFGCVIVVRFFVVLLCSR